MPAGCDLEMRRRSSALMGSCPIEPLVVVGIVASLSLSFCLLGVSHVLLGSDQDEEKMNDKYRIKRNFKER